MIYIIIPVFNRISFTVACLQALRLQTHKEFKVIVVDDGSTDGTAVCVEENFPEVLLIKGDGNLWWSGAINAGIKKAFTLSRSQHDYILTLNNDLTVGDDYLEYLFSLCLIRPNALIGSVSVDFRNHNIIHFAGVKYNASTAKYKAAFNLRRSYVDLLDRGNYIETDILPGRGTIIPIAAFLQLGLFDERAFPHYMADEDFSLRAKKAGYHLIVSTRAVVFNHVEATGISKSLRGWKHIKEVLTSIKSPSNLSNRWNWARRHAAIPSPLYFAIDMSRILKNLLLKFPK